MKFLRPLKQGDSLRDGPHSAGAWNELVSAAAYVDRARRSDRRPGRGLQFPDATRVRVKNASGVDRDRFGVLGIDDSVFTPTTNAGRFKNAIYLEGNTPAAPDHYGKILVLCQPIKAGKIGWAWATGSCVVQVSFAYDDQPYADIKDGDAGLLEADEGGGAQILWKESGTGAKWAIVRLGIPWYPTIEGTLDSDVTAAGNTTVSVAGTSRDITAYMPTSPGTGKKWASGSTVFCARIVDAWKIISVAVCPVNS